LNLSENPIFKKFFTFQKNPKNLKKEHYVVPKTYRKIQVKKRKKRKEKEKN
jgi:hypothetical protein